MPDKEEYFKATEADRHRIAYRLIQQNPPIVTEYLDLRFRLLFQHVLGKKFDVSDHWYRFEWQARGSGHIHGFLWIKDAPEVEQATEYLKYWGARVTAINPGADLPPAEVHPSSRPFATRQNTLHELAELLSRVQHHRCMPQYCHRRDKITKQIRCRFAFPWPHQDTPTVQPFRPSNQPGTTHGSANTTAPCSWPGWRILTSLPVPMRKA